MLLSYALIGLGSTGLARRGIRPVHLIGAGVGLSVVALAAIVAGAIPATLPLWIAYGAFSCFGTLVYPRAAQGFPASLAGRATTALNVLVFLGAFGLQWGLGVAIDALRAAGLANAGAHRAAFAGLLGAQVLAYAWFAAAGRRRVAAGRAPAAMARR
jgi:hypothetical protein